MAEVISRNDNWFESCHNLCNVGGSVALAGVGNTGWTGLGAAVSDRMSAAEALEFGCLAGWDLAKLPQHVFIPDKESVDGPSGENAGKWIDTGCFAVVRQDHGVILTQGKAVGERYTIVPNEDLIDLVDKVIDGSTGGIGAEFETVGALGLGETVWMLAHYPAGDFAVGRGGVDTTKAYLLLTSTHDGSGSICCFPTSVRAVCNNTLRLAIRSSRGSEQRYSMRHTTNVQSNLDTMRRTLGLATKTFAQFAAVAETMAARPIAPGKFVDEFIDRTTDATIADVAVTAASLSDGSILKAIDGLTDRELRVAFERQFLSLRDKRGKLFDDIMDRYESPRCQVPGAEGTLWAAFNAVTESVDHGVVCRYQGTERAKAETRFMSIINGKADGYKQVALAVAQELLAV